jgi:hypothetical protein
MKTPRTITASEDAANSRKIEDTRRAAGGEMDRCPTCTRTPDAPFRRIDPSGAVVHGCINACHTGRLSPTTNSGVWHSRQAARVLRKETRLHLEVLTTPDIAHR